MAVYDYLALYDRVEAVVYENTTREIRADKLQQLLKDIIDSQIYMVYDPDREYDVGACCVYDGGTPYMYVCIAPTSGVFVGADWEQVGV